MRKYRLGDLKAFACDGVAKDYTNYDCESFKPNVRHLTLIGYSTGIYGVSGCLMVDARDETLAVITKRTVPLFMVI